MLKGKADQGRTSVGRGKGGCWCVGGKRGPSRKSAVKTIKLFCHNLNKGSGSGKNEKSERMDNDGLKKGGRKNNTVKTGTVMSNVGGLQRWKSKSLQRRKKEG